ncbi:site-specific DNA-methyltransferase [Parageobacillus thermoglucosidasius]|uniref:DNA methylase N-4 n=2 Tax=Bacillota TaxID=1239 RepID=A0AAN0YQ16_PARTM|nr:site-specific DNA-methyltransferase [Parageobacillus thermoglucosidasius]ALF10320.1 DNA methylase N-4 [Parageobacillus thermoglucosidasius]ANZ30400.1 DNA methylase N-4 [Parageobacillus thermoglucosidasius]KJX68500.1 DNA methylase N-4 [Parageobacillus thermoglucosidasius]RDE21727.1 site-specific DNA-methyltransferase [Parageobacillus thermoglucosidasius]GAJ41890.1 putative methyltransferase [Parageobacillus thermoglucosidasius NBRC 107763]
MEKLDGKSMDIVKTNIEALKQLFPEVVTEGKIDFEKLKLILGEEIETRNEKYEFTWHGKTQAMKLAQTPSTGTLRPDKASSKNWDTTENLYIEGDNLEVLKLLQKSYFGKIKMIYIDPPYNTGKDFVYKDDFRDNIKNYKEITQQTTKANTETSGRYHTDWLNMMYPRLKLARNLLTDDGVIFISIDDTEVANLRKILDEIFGENNFIASITRNTNSSKNQSLFVSVSHDYCLIYARDISVLSTKHAENKWSVPKNNIEEYKRKIEELKNLGLSNEQITEELKQLTKYPRFIDFVNYWYVDERGVYRKGDLGGVKNGNMTPIINPLTGKEDPVPPGGFRYSPEKLNELIKENRIHFHTDGSLPTIKRYLDENLAQRPKSIMSDDQRPDNALLKEFNTPFDNPKQLAFMKRILSVGDKDSIILDFFSGSATTAHAVMQLNAEDGGNRKFIMVQLPEKTDEKSEAYKAGYKNICEIGKERIRRAGEKIVQETGKTDLDIGFKVFKLDSSNVKTWDPDFDNLEQTLFDLQDNIKEDRTKEDLLYEILLKIGLPLTIPIEEIDYNGKTIYNVAYGSVLVCLEDDIDLDIVQEMLKYQSEHMPPKVIFKESGFISDAVKTNAIQTLKKHGITDVRSV